jgi:Ubiquitin-2 like Rad60 SUMO-like
LLIGTLSLEQLHLSSYLFVVACFLGTFTLSQFHNNYTPKTGEETFFKIKKSTRMQKVFDTYAQRKGIQASSLRFLLDGEKIGPDQTPKMLELDDQDQIDCMLEQVCREQFIEGNLCRNVLLSVRMPVRPKLLPFLIYVVSIL